MLEATDWNPVTPVYYRVAWRGGILTHSPRVYAVSAYLGWHQTLEDVLIEAYRYDMMSRPAFRIQRCRDTSGLVRDWIWEDVALDRR